MHELHRIIPCIFRWYYTTSKAEGLIYEFKVIPRILGQEFKNTTATGIILQSFMV